MPMICQNKMCAAVFGERTDKREALVCPKCGGTDIYVPSKKSLKNIDPRIMPYRLKPNLPVNDLKTMSFFKVSTFTDEDKQVDMVVIHKAKENKDGNELLISPSPLKPYFYIDEDSYKQNTNNADYILNRYHAVVKNVEAYGTDGSKVMLLEFRNDLDRKGAVFKIDKICKTYESNRPLTGRLYVDLDLSVKALPTHGFLDLEVDPRGPPSLNNTDGRVLCACATDNSITSKKREQTPYNWLLKNYDDYSEKNDVLIPLFKWAFNYSCTAGFYSTKFDTPYSQIRAMRLGIGWDWDFVSAMDMHNIYTVMQLYSWDQTKFNLQNVAMREFGEGKDELENYSIIWDWWRNKDPRLLTYCGQDSDLLRRIDQKWQAIENRLITTNMTYTRPDAYVAYMQGLESIVVSILSRRVPKQVLHTPFRERFDARIEGALVFDPVKGVHPWCVFLDYKSMYNRIMQTCNIGFDTIDPEGDIITPTARFTSKKDSVVRDVLQRIEYWREYWKKKRDEYEPYSEDWNIMEKKQWVFKYFLVSLYGIISSPWSFVFKPEVGGAITSMGQVFLKTARRVSEFEGFPVVYGDTDSCAFKIPNLSAPKDPINDFGDLEYVLDKARPLVDKVAYAVNYFAKSRFGIKDPNIEVEVDKVFSTAYFSNAKKKYAGMLIWKGVKLEKPRLHITGFEAKRTDWSDFIRAVQKKCFLLRFSGYSESKVAEFMKNVIKELYEGKYDNKIAQRKTLRKKLNPENEAEKEYSYKGTTPYVRAAKMWEQVTGKKFGIAQEVQYHMDTNSNVIPVVQGQSIKIPNGVYDYVRDQMLDVLERAEIPRSLILSQTNISEVFA